MQVTLDLPTFSDEELYQLIHEAVMVLRNRGNHPKKDRMPEPVVDEIVDFPWQNPPTSPWRPYIPYRPNRPWTDKIWYTNNPFEIT